MVTSREQVATVAGIRRYPVKSLLGEVLEVCALSSGGMDGDRRHAVVDRETGAVASGKRPARWRQLLTLGATTTAGGVVVTFPDGRALPAESPELEAALSAFTGRSVTVRSTRQEGDFLERSVPEQVVEEGASADVDVVAGRVARGSPGTNFVDYAPLHLVPLSSVRRLTAAPAPAEPPMETERYRPNLVLECADDVVAEHDWIGRRLHIGGDRGTGGVTLRIVLPTPRCAVPTLAHGRLPERRSAFTAAARVSRFPVPESGDLPCVGVYAEIEEAGTVTVGDAVRLL